MLEWLNFKAEQVIPDGLRGPFEQTYIEPLKRQKRDQQIAEQLRIPSAIQRIEAQLKELAPKEEAASVKRLEIERQLADIQSDLSAAKVIEYDLHWRAADLRSQVETLKARQAQCGSPLLIEFHFEMLRKWDELRNAGTDEFREGKKNLLTGKIKKSVWSNRPGVDRTIACLRDAMRKAEAMRAEPLSDVEVTSRLDQLRKNIPDVGAWERFDVQGPQFLERGYDRYGGEVKLPANY